MNAVNKTIEERGSKAPTLRGTVTSVAAASTITVEVKTLKTHPKYGKQYRSSKKYLVHVSEGKYVVGDTVTFRECRPISKRKRHMVVGEAR